METSAIPLDWYRTSFSENYYALFWEEGGEEKARLAIAMLELEGRPRILDLACATGRRTLELSRRGFDVVGVDIRAGLLEVAGCDAEEEGLLPWFVEADTRDLECKAEFDLVLSLGGGAFEHFESDEENLRGFAAAARALRPGGRLLMQTPNVLRVEAHLPAAVRISGGRAEDVIEQRWDAATRRIDGARVCYLEEDPDEVPEAAPFQRRLYAVEELAEVFASVGLGLGEVFDDGGAPCVPSEAQREIYVEARK